MRLISMILLLVGLVVSKADASEELDFNRDIRPILSDNCFYCHGPDKSQRKAGLRLDDHESAIKTKAVVPGSASKSILIERINSTDQDVIMPPPEAKKKLSSAQKETLKRWIDQGGRYKNHWAYEPLAKPSIPSGQNAIDYLVSKRLAKIGLSPSEEADKRTLVRRLYFDLLGLPPTPEVVVDFEKDKSPNAYANLVEKILSSPHYGERMAIAWLDVVRFADTIGYHSDTSRNIWPYRDYVINSFNQNKKFDRFTMEQIAGDLLPDASQETRVGSGFNRLLLSTEEGGAQPKDYESRMLTDRVRAIGAAWLGQTTGCAQCHDHKFDPMTARDFYSLGAFFSDIQEAAIGKREEGMAVPDEMQKQKLAKMDAELEQLRNKKPVVKEEITAAEKSRKLFHDSLPRTLVSVSMEKKRVVRLLPRGNWQDETGEIMKPAFPAFLPQMKVEGRELNRLDLAKWLVSRDNPLTARTVMNRFWKQFFGVGLSKVLDDLGAQGELPLNPELLDWLASEFIDSGWDMKHMVRTMVNSKTYRQDSRGSKELLLKDPYNRELSRQSRFRVDAEIVRDNALAVSGLLVAKIGGPSVKPYQPDRYWENLNFPTREYVADKGDSQYRRGLYVWWQRTFLHPSMLAFDAPSREECAADRNRSNIPQQALVLLNDPTYVEAAKAFACKILKSPGSATADRITWAWQQVLQRNPTADELSTIQILVEKRLHEYRNDEKSAQQLFNVGLFVIPDGLDKAEVAAWTHVARVLLNLHETITRY